VQRHLSSSIVKLLASSAGAIVAALVGVPLELIKHRVQLGMAGCTTPRLALAHTLRNSGVPGLYTGLRSTLARNIPFNALHFGVFECASSMLSNSLDLQPFATAMVAGAAAGAITALLTTPLDVVNTRLQTQPLSSSAAASTEPFLGPMDAFARISREEGAAALMRGAGVRVVQYAPSALIFFSIYSASKRLLLL
jgi:solute carrier family 25 S-adenosylmethionine transporter 26